jgi:hypothetical protein
MKLPIALIYGKNVKYVNSTAFLFPTKITKEEKIVKC